MIEIPHFASVGSIMCRMEDCRHSTEAKQRNELVSVTGLKILGTCRVGTRTSEITWLLELEFNMEYSLDCFRSLDQNSCH